MDTVQHFRILAAGAKAMVVVVMVDLEGVQTESQVGRSNFRRRKIV